MLRGSEMGRRSPLVTLAATAVGLVALLVVDSTQATSGNPAPAPATTVAPSSTPSSPAPSATPTPSPTATPTRAVTVVYAGRTANRRATLAIAVYGARAAAYLCDGRRVEAWLTGTQTAGRLALRSRSGSTLTGTVKPGGTVTGTVTAGGQAYTFTIGVASPPAGLYRARTRIRGTVVTIGWIVLPDGRQVGVSNDGTPEPAPTLDPRTRTARVDDVPVTAGAVSGSETF